MFKTRHFILLIISTAYLLEASSENANEPAFRILCRSEIDASSTGPQRTDIVTDLCTHIIYDSVTWNNDSNKITFKNGWDGFSHRYGEQIIAYKKKGIKVLVSVGGDDDSGEKYSNIVRYNFSRELFVNEALSFVEIHMLDGLDLYWRHRVCWERNCSKGHKDELNNYGLLAKNLSSAFKRDNLIVSGSVAAEKEFIDEGYDIPILVNRLEWLTITTTDYHVNSDNCGKYQ